MDKSSPGNFGRIEELVAGMFRDLGTRHLPATLVGGSACALPDRLGSSISAFVTVDTHSYPLAAAAGLIDQRLPSPRRPTRHIGYVEWLAADQPFAAPARRHGASGEIARRVRQDMIDSKERPDIAEPTHSTDPTENAETAEPIEPTDRTDPTDPTESNEFFEQMESIDPSERIDHVEASND